MQFTSLSKSVRTIGVMILLSAIVGTSMQQNAQAQSGAKPKVACITLPPDQSFFNEFEGITFSREQDEAYQKIRTARDAKSNALSKTFRAVADPERNFGTIPKPGTSDEKMEEISDDDTTLIRANVSNDLRREMLTRRHGRYATFLINQNFVFTPEQIATGRKIWRDSEAQTMAIFTPEQQKIYQAKLVIVLGLEACDETTPSSPRLFSTYITVDGIRRGV